MYACAQDQGVGGPKPIGAERERIGRVAVREKQNHEAKLCAEAPERRLLACLRRRRCDEPMVHLTCFGVVAVAQQRDKVPLRRLQ